MFKKKWFKALQAVAFIALGIFLIFYFWKNLTADEQSKVFDNFGKANYWFLLLSLLTGLIQYFIRAARWNLLIETFDKPPRLGITFWSLMNGYMVNLVVPRLGEVSRCAMLSNNSKIHFDKLFGSMLAERVFDLLTYFFIFIMAVVMFYGRLENYLYENLFCGFSNKLESMSFSKIAILLLCAVIFVFAVIWLVRKFKNITLFVKIRDFFINLKNGLLSIFKLKRRGLFFFYTILIWFFYLLMTYTIYFSLDITKTLPFSSAFVILAFGTISMIVIQGGIGIYPVIVSGILLLYGISEPDGYAIGWMNWGLQTLLALFLGLLSFVILPLHKNKNKIKE